MKSPMVTRLDFIKDKDCYSDLQVMHSGAGYYIGTTYLNPGERGKSPFPEPGSRDTPYFDTEQRAEMFLKFLEETEKREGADIVWESGLVRQMP